MDGGSARRKAATYTAQHEHRKTQTEIYASIEVRTHHLCIFELPKMFSSLDGAVTVTIWSSSDIKIRSWLDPD
jgi:hypothetical protein